MSKRLSQLGHTIFNLSTGHAGKSGVAVVRISGPNAFEPFRSTMVPGVQEEQLPNRKLVLCDLVDPQTALPLDKGMCVKFSAPHSFTGEDMLEFHLHGSIAVTSGVLEALGKLPDFRLSYRGEFTQRAYDNNKLGLLEVEAMSDLLRAETGQQRVVALNQLGGNGMEVISNWREALISARAQTEAILDFGDEDDIVEDVSILSSVVDKLKSVRSEMQRHLSNRSVEIMRNGMRVSLVGPPNVGKSSLMNALVNRELSIVTDIPGTTRDVLEAHIDLHGVTTNIFDTAGIRPNSSDPVERIGMERAQQNALEADVCVCVLDGDELRKGHGIDSVIDGLISRMKRAPDVYVLNKYDLVLAQEGYEGSLVDDVKQILRHKLVRDDVDQSCVSTPPPVLAVSCWEHIGIEALKDILVEHVSPLVDSDAEDEGCALESIVVSRARHRARLSEAVIAIEKSTEHFERIVLWGGHLELAAEELRLATRALEQLAGTIDTEDVLDVLFEEFCIGK